MKIDLKKEVLNDGRVRFVPKTEKDAALLPPAYELYGRVKDDGSYAVQVGLLYSATAISEQRDLATIWKAELRQLKSEVNDRIERMLSRKDPTAEVDVGAE